MTIRFLQRSAAIAALFLAPLSSYAGIVTLNLSASLADQTGAHAGSLNGSLSYELETGVVSFARVFVSLLGADDIFDLNLFDPESNVIAKDGDKPKKPIIIFDNVDGESLDKGHKAIEMVIPDPPGPARPVADFTGTFLNRLDGGASTTYGVKGTAAVAIPEPATVALVIFGLGAAGLARRRHRQIRA